MFIKYFTSKCIKFSASKCIKFSSSKYDKCAVNVSSIPTISVSSVLQQELNSSTSNPLLLPGCLECHNAEGVMKCTRCLHGYGMSTLTLSGCIKCADNCARCYLGHSQTIHCKACDRGYQLVGDQCTGRRKSNSD